MTETLGDVLKVGTDATEEVAKIGVKAIGAAPSILEQKIAFAQAQWPKINISIRKFSLMTFFTPGIGLKVSDIN